MRVTDASGLGVVSGDALNEEQKAVFDSAVQFSKGHYAALVRMGAKLEDARGVLPLNTECNLICKYNFRSFTDLVKARKSLRAQGEYFQIVKQMERSVLEVWPWAKPFFESDADVAIQILEDIAKNLGITTGKGAGWEIAKAIDLLRKE